MRGERSEFALSDTKLNLARLNASLDNPSTGALVTFVGRVRNHNEGQSVLRLDYEAYEALAEKEGRRIIEEALEKFEIEDAVCIHRTGRLIIGDAAVWVGVISAHRDAAFQATRYIIDQVKTRLPIWKKEHYQNGEAVWVNCLQCAHAEHAHGQNRLSLIEVETRAQAYYQRQTLLKEIGAAGQEKLGQASVLVIGAGGLGSGALPYLAGAGIGRLGICEPDTVDISNLHRQVMYTLDDVGKSKAEQAAHHLRMLNPYIQVTPHAETVTTENIDTLMADYDLVLDCTDNFTARFLLSDTATRLKKPLIQASVHQYEGQIQGWFPENPGGCLRCQWPEMTSDAVMGTCSEVGVLGPIPGLLGALQAMEAIKYLVGLPTPLTDQMLIFDGLTYQTRLLKRPVQPDCPSCGLQNNENVNIPNAAFLNEAEFLLTPDDDFSLSDYVVIDVSEAREHVPIPQHPCLNIPFSRFDLEQPRLERQQHYLLYCTQGTRSAHLVESLRQRGYEHVWAMSQALHQQLFQPVLQPVVQSAGKPVRSLSDVSR